MKTLTVLMTSGTTGKQVQGDHLLCDCGSEVFRVIVMNGIHTHLNCPACNTTYCHGTDETEGSLKH